MPRERRPLRWAAAAVAAVAATILLISNPFGDRAGPVLRNDADRAGITVVAPTAGSTATTPVRFVWRAFAPELRYRLTVTTAEGREIWTAEGSDTAVVQPTTLVWEPEVTYVWFVDTFLADGTTASTGVIPFTVQP